MLTIATPGQHGLTDYPTVNDRQCKSLFQCNMGKIIIQKYNETKAEWLNLRPKTVRKEALIEYGVNKSANVIEMLC